MLELVLKSGKHDGKKACYDCYHQKAAITLWCTNKKAVAYKGSNLTPIHSCYFWEPCLTIEELSWFRRTFRGGNFIYVKGREK
jgi:hypothetical protein